MSLRVLNCRTKQTALEQQNELSVMLARWERWASCQSTQAQETGLVTSAKHCIVIFVGHLESPLMKGRTRLYYSKMNSVLFVWSTAQVQEQKPSTVLREPSCSSKINQVRVSRNWCRIVVKLVAQSAPATALKIFSRRRAYCTRPPSHSSRPKTDLLKGELQTITLVTVLMRIATIRRRYK